MKNPPQDLPLPRKRHRLPASSVSVYITKETQARLRKYAEENGFTFSSIVETAIHQYLQGKENGTNDGKRALT